SRGRAGTGGPVAWSCLTPCWSCGETVPVGGIAVRAPEAQSEQAYGQRRPAALPVLGRAPPGCTPQVSVRSVRRAGRLTPAYTTVPSPSSPEQGNPGTHCAERGQHPEPDLVSTSGGQRVGGRQDAAGRRVGHRVLGAQVAARGTDRLLAGDRHHVT